MPKITDFTVIDAVADEDLFAVVDVSDDDMSPAGTNRAITVEDLADSIALKIFTTLPNIVQSALNAKANLSGGATFTGSIVLPSSTVIGGTTSTEISYLAGVTSGIQTQLNNKANLASPTFTGTVTSPTFSGNATSATILQTSRTIGCSGAVSGSASFNGSANAIIVTTLTDESVTPSKLSVGGPTWNSGGTLTATAFSGPLTGTATGNVKQGGGPGQTNDNIAIGLGGSQLLVQVGSTDYGATWPINISGTVPNLSITTEKVADGAITLAKLADGSVTAQKLDGGQSGAAPIFGIRAFGYARKNLIGTMEWRSQNGFNSTITGSNGTYTISFLSSNLPNNLDYTVLVTGESFGTATAQRFGTVYARTLESFILKFSDDNTLNDNDAFNIMVLY
jgi:hypothetical protein